MEHKYTVFMLVLALSVYAIVLLSYYTVYGEESYVLVLNYTDDFNYANDSSASANWLIYRVNNNTSTEVYWDQVDSAVYLTTATNDSGGAIYLKGVDLRLFKRWEVDFIYYIGNGTGADGFAFTFFHQPGIDNIGGSMGYSGLPGYNIEFDTYTNVYDPVSAPHIALTYNSSSSHIYIFLQGVNIRNTWMYARVIFEEIERNGTTTRGNLTVMVWNGADLASKTPAGSIILNKTITLDFNVSYGYMGFSAATGGLYDNHVLDWVEVKGYNPPIIGGELILGDDSGNRNSQAYSQLLLAAATGLVGLSLLVVVARRRTSATATSD